MTNKKEPVKFEKEIILNEKNVAKIDAFLDELQKRCSERMLTAKDIKNVLDKVEKHLGIPKKYLEGVRVNFDNAEHFPTTYRYTPNATQFSAVFKNGKWKITNIFRGICNNSSTSVYIKLTDAAKEQIVRAKETIGYAVIKYA